MNDTIEVWHPKIVIPSSLKAPIADFTFDWSPGRFRDDYGVEPVKLNGVEALYADGICSWHDDEHFPNQYSLLLVVRNDFGSYVEARGETPIKEQPVGTMILLNIWKKHRLWHPKGKRSPVGVYLAMCIDTGKKPKSRRECEAMMRGHMKGVYLREAALL